MSSLNKALQTNAGYIAGVIVENPFVQAFLGLLVYGGIAFVLMFTDAGQRITGDLLDIGSKRGIELLRETKWIFRAQNGKWHAYADKIDAGYVEVKYATYTNTAGEEISTQQVFVTPKGMARLSIRLQQH